jgi:hypothetical protein
MNTDKIESASVSVRVNKKAWNLKPETRNLKLLSGTLGILYETTLGKEV